MSDTRQGGLSQCFKGEASGRPTRREEAPTQCPGLRGGAGRAGADPAAWGRAAHLEVPVDDGRLLPVHVLHGAAGLVEDLQHGVAGQRPSALAPLQELHQLPWKTRDSHHHGLPTLAAGGAGTRAGTRGHCEALPPQTRPLRPPSRHRRHSARALHAAPAQPICPLRARPWPHQHHPLTRELGHLAAGEPTGFCSPASARTPNTLSRTPETPTLRGMWAGGGQQARPPQPPGDAERAAQTAGRPPPAQSRGPQVLCGAHGSSVRECVPGSK